MLRVGSAEAAFLSGMVEYAADVVEHFAHVHAAIDKLGMRRFDVRNDEMKSLCRPPRAADVILWPKMIEHGEPGGVNCTTRNCSLLAKSASSRHPKVL